MKTIPGKYLEKNVPNKKKIKCKKLIKMRACIDHISSNPRRDAYITKNKATDLEDMLDESVLFSLIELSSHAHCASR